MTSSIGDAFTNKFCVPAHPGDERNSFTAGAAAHLPRMAFFLMNVIEPMAEPE